jgi:hypothetical protein
MRADKEKSMRTLFFSCLLALGVAVAVWLHHGSGELPASVNHQATGAQTPVQSAAGKPAARAADSRAGIALRSTSILATPSKQMLASGNDAAAERAPVRDTRKAPASEGEQAPAQPKSAAELFTPFIEDDPSQVFPPSTVHYHAAFQSETADPDWGPSTAAALRNYLISKFGDRFEIPLVDCRQDLCELQVAGRPGSGSAADMNDVQQMMLLLKQSALWSQLQLDQETSIIGSSPDGRALWLSFISRM